MFVHLRMVSHIRTIEFIPASDARPKTTVPAISLETRMGILQSAEHRRAQGIVWGEPRTMPYQELIALTLPRAADYEVLSGYSIPHDPYDLFPEAYVEAPYPFRTWLATAVEGGQSFPSPLPAPTPLNCASFVLSELVAAKLLTAHEVHCFYLEEDEKYADEENDEGDLVCSDTRYCAPGIAWMDGPGEWITAHSTVTDAHWADIVMEIDIQSGVPMSTEHVGFLGGISPCADGTRMGILLSDWEGDVRKTSSLSWYPMGENNLYRRVPLEDVIARVKEKAALFAAIESL